MKKVYQSGLFLALAGVTAALPTASTYAMMQDETVYVKLQATGETKEVSVVEHLINDLKADQLFDQSTLSGIENLNGFESYSADGKSLTWEAKGKDIYYQGKADQALPVQLEISYKLNSETKTIDEIIGQAGQVEITLRYKNLSKIGNLYTPFVAAVATTLDESKVSDVQVTNGKATSNGRKIAIAGVAAPGLYESLGLEELRGSDTVTIKYTAEKFELNDIYTIVTPKLLDSADLKTFTELDQLYAKTNQLATSSKQLVEGSAELQTGVQELRSAVLKLKQQTTASCSTKVEANLVDDTTLAQIRTQAGQAAAAKMEAQKPAMMATIVAQLRQNTSLVGALQAAGAPVDAVLKQLAESSYELAKQTAVTTAEETATNLTNILASQIQQALSQTLAGVPDMLLAGIDQLAAGANQLHAGMKQFDQEGIQTLANFVNGEVKVTTSKVKQLMSLAEQYNNYAGIAPDVKGTTKFVMMVEARKK